MKASTLRWLVAVVCVVGIAGMIVFSVGDNNGGAMTFGILTAIASLVLLSVTAVLKREVGEAPGPAAGSIASPAVLSPEAPEVRRISATDSRAKGAREAEAPGAAAATGGGRRAGAPVATVVPRAEGAPAVDEELAQWVEVQVGRLVAEGADESALRSLVGDAVRLGRGR